MSRVAIFVDAGYLFAQGSAALAGRKQPRSSITLNDTAVVAELQAVASTHASSVPLLRIYWYDGAEAYKGPSAEHAKLAHTDDIKLRLGFLNSVGQQKGVDSLIVTDLVELARNSAISEAVLLSGDEDIRIGVQIAQNFGVRVHLLGIVPCRGSQSRHLQQEADTTTEWGRETIAKFLTIRQSVAAASSETEAEESTTPASSAKSEATSNIESSSALDSVAELLFGSMEAAEVAAVLEARETIRGVPREYDGKLLARSRESLGRDLGVNEKRYIRKKFIALITRTADA